MPITTAHITRSFPLSLVTALLGIAALSCSGTDSTPDVVDAGGGHGGAGAGVGTGGASGRSGGGGRASGGAVGATGGRASGGTGGSTSATGGAAAKDAGAPDATRSDASPPDGGRKPDSGGVGADADACTLSLARPSVPDAIQVPSDARLVGHFHAVGTQRYACVASAETDGGTTYDWGLPTPDATLFDGCGTPVATHFSGPTWRSISDHSTVTGAAIASSPSANAIPWLLLRSVTTAASGLFANILLIQRVETTGGVSPTDGCAAGDAGDTVAVPYTADYYFYAATCAAAVTVPEQVVVLNDGAATPLPCEFMLPPSGGIIEVNPKSLNLRYTPAGAVSVALGYVPSAADCGSGALGWHFDDPSAPTRAILCPSTCSAGTTAAFTRLEILLGCPRAELPLP